MTTTLATILTAASTWWGGFCERNLVSDDPTQVILDQQLIAPTQHAAWLIERYRYLGSKAYYGDKHAAKDLGYIGDELRAYGIGQDVLEDYSKFER